MPSTRTVLEEFGAHLDESMGVRQSDPMPQLSPRASTKDIGRTPLRKFGRLKLDQIVPDPSQPRREFDPKEIQRLAGSIRKAGQLHPIRVRWDGELEKWIIVTGERRYRAAAVARLDEIDCYFLEDAVTQPEILEQQLIENLLREDLKPLEEARGYASLVALNGWTGKQVAASLHVSPSRVSRAMALLDLPDDVQSRIESGEIPRTTAYELSKLDSEAAQRALAKQAAAGSFTHRQTTRSVRQRKGKAATKPHRLRQTFVCENDIKVAVSTHRKVTYHDLEQALREVLDEVRTRIDNNIQLY